MKKNIFSYEITDTFSGEANYCWVIRGTVKAKSFRGAITAIKRKEKIRCRHLSHDFGDMCRVDFSRGGWLACMFVEYSK
jgi:hypothetical protein